MDKRILKRAVITLAVCALLGGGLFACSPKSAAVHFALHRRAYEEAAEQALELGDGSRVERPFGTSSIGVYQDGPEGETQWVEFSMGAGGFASQTCYWGVTCTTGDDPVGFQGVEQEFVRDGEGWLWEEPEGDNWCRVTPLADHWYFYEMHF